MRYRALDAAGDMTFGRGSVNFLVNSPAAVAQAILTRLRLLVGEWFLDVTEGTDYAGKVLGYGTRDTRDVEIRNRILETQGVSDIADYSSSLTTDRKFSVAATVNTIYGQLTVLVGDGIIPAPTGLGILDFSIVGNVLIVVI